MCSSTRREITFLPSISDSTCDVDGILIYAGRVDWNGLYTFLKQYKDQLTRKLLEPYMLVMVCSQDHSDSVKPDQYCSTSDPRGDQVLTAVARYYLSEHSNAYVFTPIEEGRFIPKFNELRDHFAGFISDGHPLPIDQQELLREMAKSIPQNSSRTCQGRHEAIARGF